MSTRDLSKAQIKALQWLAGRARGNTATRDVMNRLAELGYVEGGPGERRLTEFGRDYLERIRGRTT